jgi:iron uptake system component EfeO
VSGRAASGPTAATGFHKVEALLWSGARMAEIKEAANGLRMLVLRLVRHFQTATVRPTTIPVGLPRVVEAAIQVELSGRTDAGSHTGLATVSANLSGAAEALNFVTPLLETRYPRLRETLAAFASSQALIQTFARSGDWVPLHDLTADERDRLSYSLQELVGLLTPIATICRSIR